MKELCKFCGKRINLESTHFQDGLNFCRKECADNLRAKMIQTTITENHEALKLLSRS